MVEPLEKVTPDPKPPRLVTLYIPGALGVVFGIGTQCLFMRPTTVMEHLFGGIGAFLISWPFCIAGYHGYRFFRSFVRRT
jgi:hypothetical protein